MTARTHGTDDTYDIVIVGAGITGIYQLYRLLEAGYSVRLLESGAGVGGTWYWNRYPSARVDAESYSYGYFFSKELYREWKWTEHFASQTEMEAYLNYVVDRFGLRPFIHLNSRVVAAIYDDLDQRWSLVSDEVDGSIRARIVVSATGWLSIPYYPEIPGISDFRGEMYHTARWPAEPVDFGGKRVAMIGTGSSGAQLFPAIAEAAAAVTLFQRTPNWCIPLNNSTMSSAERAAIEDRFQQLYDACRSTSTGLMYGSLSRSTFDDSRQERWNQYEILWKARGLSKLVANYADLLSNRDANREFSKFIEEKIRELVDDPQIADKLIPRDHGFGMKRPPVVAGYYEAFNLSTVSLVDVRATPILRITDRGLKTKDDESEFDMIILATGFDVGTGALARMGIVGTHQQKLNDYWADGPRTYLGLAAPGFPNLLFPGGPHGPIGNVSRSTEVQVDFVTGLIQFMYDHGFSRVEVVRDAEEEWTKHVYAVAEGRLIAENSYVLGTNIPGKPRRYLLYSGGLVKYREALDEVTRESYVGFTFT